MSTLVEIPDMNINIKSEEKKINKFGYVDIAEIINEISLAKWKFQPYKAQNWGNWLHRMSAYVGRIKPAMAHLLIEASTNKDDIILDPFCGTGTVPLEADLLDRKSYGIDLSPYAFAISDAKFDRKAISEHISWLESVTKEMNNDSINKVDISQYSEYVRKFYDDRTLKEIKFIYDKIVAEKRDFLLGCLLGIIHGHRIGHLSAKTSLVIPYDPRTSPEYREVIPRLIKKVKRMYINGFPLVTESKIFHADAREIPLEDNSADIVISSPPYYNTLDYVNDNRLRLEFLGYKKEDKDILKKELIQDKNNYIEDMKKVGLELKRVLKEGSYIIYILGDLHQGKNIINTADEVRRTYEELGFKFHGIIDDDMPINKCVPSNVKREKLDRILIMSNS